jgi:hypothetical protein
MTIEQVKAAYGARPFQPFVFRLADGRGIPVLSSEFMMFSPGGRTVHVVQPDESWNIIDLLLVTDLDFKPLPAGKQPYANGVA